MKPLRVGYVLKVYPRLSETFIVNEIVELERRGVDVTIFSLRLPADGRFHEKLARVRADVVYLPDRTPAEFLESIARHREELAPVRARLGELLWDELAEQPSLRSLAKALDLSLAARRRGIRHLHAHFATSATGAAHLASRLSGTPYSFTAHAKDIYHESGNPEELRRRMEDASFVVTVCDANRDHLERLRVGGTPVRRIYNGLDLQEFRPRAGRDGGRFRVLGVGRLVPKKGFDVLLDAAGRLRDRGLEFECRLVGDGIERERLARRIEALSLHDVVRMTGALPVEAVREEIAAADVLALPARIDGDGNRDALPTVLLEAMALGRPFVSTPVVGIPEIAGDNEAGRLVPPDDPQALADELARLAAAGDERRALGQAGRERAQRLFDVRRSVRELHALFESAADAAASVSVSAGERSESCASST